MHGVTRIVEKPKLADAPSDLAISGRYLLDPAVFAYLHELTPGAGGEIQFTDALQQLARHEGLLAYEYEGRYYDGGNKLELIKATVDFALKRPEFHDDLQAFLQQRTR
ncbi:MAG: sugar phosphate nucleotidyltransferase [Candidatus Andersenbacteria bacterium]